MFFRFKKLHDGVQMKPEYMIVGLGNPGGEYVGTRHNVGFEFVEFLSAKLSIRMRERKHQALYGSGELFGKAVMLVKPMTYMNLSGRAVAALAREFDVLPEKIIVVADDLDLPVSAVRVKGKGGSGGHNGHKSIIQLLGTDKYLRIKIGIGKRNGEDVADYVLSKFSKSEGVLIGEAFDIALRGCEILFESGLEKAMNVVNSSG